MDTIHLPQPEPTYPSIEKTAVFRPQLALIQEPFLQNCVSQCLTEVDPKFFVAPASSSGKYHSADDCVIGKWSLDQTDNVYRLIRPGGLVHHTQMAVRLAGEAMRRYQSVDTHPYAQDAIYAAVLLHDACKNGLPGEWGAHTVKHHGELGAAWVLEQLLGRVEIAGQERDINSEEYDRAAETAEVISYAIYQHMGRWHGHEEFLRTKTAADHHMLPEDTSGAGGMPYSWTLDAVISRHRCDPIANVVVNITQEADYYGSRKWLVEDKDNRGGR